MSTVLWVVVPLAAMGLLYWLSTRIEPHWVSKDRQRFVCMAQPITYGGDAGGRAKETRVVVMSGGWLHLSQRRALGKKLEETWRIAGKSPNPPKNRVIYVLSSGGSSANQMALRLPATSKMIPTLDAMLDGGPARA